MPRFHLPHVSADTDRHGNVRYYFRKRGQRKIRLPGRPGEAAFMKAYYAARDGEIAPPPPTRQHIKPGSLRWLAREYLASRQFAGLADGTRNWLRRHIDEVCQEAVSEENATPVADIPADDMTAAAIRKLRQRKENAAGINPANERLAAIKALYRYGVEAGLVTYNPARDIPKIRNASDGFHTWTVEEVEAFWKRWPLGTKAHLALALLLFTGTRRSDVILLGRQHERTFPDEDGAPQPWLCWAVQKGRKRRPKQAEIPLLPELRTVLDTSQLGDLTYLVTRFGQPYTPSGFSAAMRRWCDAAGLPHCSAHGVRKAGACIAAENGASEAQLMAIFRWDSSDMAQLYTRGANRRKLASGAGDLLRLRKSRQEG